MGMVLQFNLSQAGFEVTLVRDGLEAIEQVKQNVFDLIITDQQMPRMSGEQFCRQARWELGVTTPMAMCTAKGLEVDAAHLVVEYDLERIFTKPFSPLEVVTFAQSLTEGQRANIPSPEVAIA